MQSKGVPQFYGLHVAMGKTLYKAYNYRIIICYVGFALIIEGVMSAIYHICPSGLNFQFGG